jgi:hypothetical protein
MLFKRTIFCLTAITFLTLSSIHLALPHYAIKNSPLSSISFFPTVISASILDFYFQAGVIFDCQNIPLLGYKKSFSVIVPYFDDVGKGNLLNLIDSDRAL